MLNLWIWSTFGDGKVQEARYSWVADHPIKSLKNVPLHLGEHVIVVKGAAHRLELLDGWNALLAVTVLGGDEEGCAANELVVALVDNAARAVPVEEVDGEEKSVRQELEGVVGLEEKIKEIRPHEPLDLLLDLDRVDVRHRLLFHELHVIKDVVFVLLGGEVRELCSNLSLTGLGDQPRLLSLSGRSSVDTIIIVVVLDKVRVAVTVGRHLLLLLESHC